MIYKSKHCLHEYHAICTDYEDVFFDCTIYAKSIREAIDLCEELDFCVNYIIETKQVSINETPKIVCVIYKEDLSKLDFVPDKLGELKWHADRRL